MHERTPRQNLRLLRRSPLHLLLFLCGIAIVLGAAKILGDSPAAVGATIGLAFLIGTLVMRDAIRRGEKRDPSA